MANTDDTNTSALREQLASLLAQEAGTRGDELGGAGPELLSAWVDAAFARLSERELTRIALLAPKRFSPFGRGTLGLHMLRLLTRVALLHWLEHVAGQTPQRYTDRLDTWISKQSREVLRRLLAAAVRSAIARPREEDTRLLNDWFSNISKETDMAAEFYIDDSAIPALRSESKKDAYLEKVQNALTSSFGMSADEANVQTSAKAAAIVGFLLLDEEYDENSLSFSDSLMRAWIESLGKTPRYQDAGAPPPSGNGNGASSGDQVPNQRVYEFVATAIVALNGNKPKVSYQELAAVSRHAIALSTSIPFEHPNFIASVRIGLDAYVGGKPIGDSLTLPSGSLPGTGDEINQESDLNGSNIVAFGTVYAIALLERTKVFHVIDRIAEMWMYGHLTIGFDAAGKAIDTFVWETEDRLSEAARMSQYGRILGMPGGEIPKEVQPNREYETLFLRFVSSVAEYDRQRRVADIFENRQSSLSLTGEQVRKAGRDLAANASLYGWGSAHFIARRLNTHLTRAIEILKLPQVQKAFGVTNPWQVVERVSISELGVTPNIVKYRTMAEASKAIFDLLARKTRELSLANSAKPFLWEEFRTDPRYEGVNGAGDLSYEETASLLRAVQHWLAVNAVPGDQVQKLSQPSEALVPSLPSFGGNRNDSNEVVSRLRQMVASGNAPSLDQLQQLIPAMR